MSYLKEFQTQISNRDFSKFMQLWEEYCASDTVEAEEFLSILKSIKQSDFAKPFGAYVETAVPLLKLIQNEADLHQLTALLLDIQTSNTSDLAELALATIQKKYAQDPLFNERLRLVGLRGKENFQGAVSNYDLLAHVEKGKFVFHLGGWGVGEVMDVSALREQMGIEFENVTGRKYLSFGTAFKALIPIPNDHFLARRFAFPDELEKEAKDDPIKVIKMLLKDLGDKTAGEIKDELCGLVIPEEDWTKWWQNARAKLKKDTLVEVPASGKDSFHLRKQELSHEDEFHLKIKDKQNIHEIILACYSFVRDYSAKLKNPETKESIQKILKDLLNRADLRKAQELEVMMSLEMLEGLPSGTYAKLVQDLANPESVIDEIQILAFKKQALVAMKQQRQDWPQMFLAMLAHIQQSPLREYMIKELLESDHRKLFEEFLNKLIAKPSLQPDFFVWYFQLVLSKPKEKYPYGDKDGQRMLMEALLILLNQIENQTGYKDLVKKIYQIFIDERFALVRYIFEGASLDYIKEFLLLASKCHTFSDHDSKIFRSLAAVAQPSLATAYTLSSATHIDSQTIWTTEAGYLQVQERIKTLGTKEIVENAREIEAARALGDLRENAEYKFALEKRSRLQEELKRLSDQLHHARIITLEDIDPNTVGVGNIVLVEDSKKNQLWYTILGPWDADPDKYILSFQSRFVQAMVGKKVGETFTFRDENYKVLDLQNYLEKKE